MFNVHKRQSGISSVVIVIVVVAVIGFLGLMGVLATVNQQKPAVQNQPVKTSEEETKAKNKPFTGETKTISFNGASYSLTLPEKWQYKELFGYPGPESNEKIVIITDPGKTYELQIKLFVAVDSNSPSKADAKFTGIGGKTYYLSGYTGIADTGFETIYVTACETQHCYTKVNDRYDLNLTISGASGDATKGITLDATEIGTIEQIIASIKIGA